MAKSSRGEDGSSLSKMGASAKGVAELDHVDPGIERVQLYLKYYLETQKDAENHDWTATILPHLSMVSHSAALPHPRITFRFTVQPVHCNALGNLHGGCTATIFDLCTSMPLGLVARPGFWQWMGVSRTLNVTYLRPVPAGARVHVECEVLQVGRKLCTIRGVMRLVEDDGNNIKEGPVLAVCEHGKVNTDPPAEKL